MKKLVLILFSLCSLSLYAATHLKTSSDVTQAEWLRMLAGLAFVVLAIFLLSWILKKIHLVGLSGNASMKLITGMSLGGREKLMLIQVDNRFLLIGVAPGGVSLIHDFGTEKPSFLELSNQSTFSTVMKAVRGKGA